MLTDLIQIFRVNSFGRTKFDIHLDKLESQQNINQLQTEMIMKQSRAIERLELIIDDLEWMLCDYDPYLCLKDQPAKIK